MSRFRQFFASRTMRTIIITAMTVIVIVSLAVFCTIDRKLQGDRQQATLAEEARIFADEMDAVWKFMEIARLSVDEEEADYYVQNRLFCAVVGRSVGALFSDGNDYKIRYTNFNPRNYLDQPDEYETEALEAFYDSAAARPYFGEEFGTTPYEDMRTVKEHPRGKTGKCTFCIDRLHEGKVPLCVKTCITKSRTFGDLDDPDSQVSRLIRETGAKQWKAELGTDPSVYYIGLA